MWWPKSSDKPSAPEGQAKSDAPEPSKSFDADKLPERRKLPAALQKIANDQDKQENLYDELVEG